MFLIIAACLLALHFVGKAIGPFSGSLRLPERETFTPKFHEASKPYKSLKALLADTPGNSIHDLNLAVHRALAHGEARPIQIHENWVLWLMGLIYPDARERQSPDQVLRGHYALCSKACVVLIEALHRRGIPAAVTDLKGHVVVEAWDQDRWVVADPDFGWVFEANAATLANDPEWQVRFEENLIQDKHQDIRVEECMRVLRQPEPVAVRPDPTSIDYRGRSAKLSKRNLNPRLAWLQNKAATASWGIPALLVLVSWAFEANSEQSVEAATKSGGSLPAMEEDSPKK